MLFLAFSKFRYSCLKRALKLKIWNTGSIYYDTLLKPADGSIFSRPFQPVALSMMLAYWEPGSDMTYEQAVYCASAVIFMSLLIGFLNHHGSYSTQQFGMKVRIAACSLIYRKVGFEKANGD